MFAPELINLFVFSLLSMPPPTISGIWISFFSCLIKVAGIADLAPLPASR
jgi:hypothetical protein